MNRERIDGALDGIARKAKSGRIRPDTALSGDGDRVERRGEGEVFLLAEDGWRYRVYDVRIAGGRMRKARHESPDATHRVFVSADGMRRSYAFVRGEVRTITAAALERQRLAAVFQTIGPLAKKTVAPR